MRDPADTAQPVLDREYSSEHDVMSFEQTRELMERRKLMVGQEDLDLDGEFLR